jgi:hypothetical protein
VSVVQLIMLVELSNIPYSETAFDESYKTMAAPRDVLECDLE